MSFQQQLIVFISAFASGDEGGAIRAYSFDPQAGRLVHMQDANDIENPFFLAVSPNRQHLYAVHATKFGGDESEAVKSYRIGPGGQLTSLNVKPTRGTASCYLDVDATGKTLVAANYSSGSVVALPVLENGQLGDPSSFIQHAGNSVNPSRQDAPHAHCSVISPDNRFVFVADLGLDQILTYQLDPAAAKLTPGFQPFVRTEAGTGPRHLTFHPNGQWLYVINEIGNTVTRYDYESKRGILVERQTISTVPKGFSGVSHTADVKVTPNGRFLYGTNRGHDSIACYRIDDDGELALLEIVPSGGNGPQNLAITPGGECLICANMPGHNVVVFRIDGEHGTLTELGSPESVISPACIMILKPVSP